MRGNALEASARSGRYSVGKHRKLSREETANAVRLLSVAELTRREMAAKLGVSDKMVDNYLAAGASGSDPLRRTRRERRMPYTPALF